MIPIPRLPIRFYTPVTVVTGPPCSGKTTYVQTHAHAGDLVFDYDAVCGALCIHDPNDVTYTWADHMKPLILNVRDALIDRLTRSNIVRHAWLIHCGGEQVSTWQRMGATVVTMPATIEECKARAMQRPNPDKWVNLIEQYATAQKVGR